MPRVSSYYRDGRRVSGYTRSGSAGNPDAGGADPFSRPRPGRMTRDERLVLRAMGQLREGGPPWQRLAAISSSAGSASAAWDTRKHLDTLVSRGLAERRGAAIPARTQWRLTEEGASLAARIAPTGVVDGSREQLPGSPRYGAEEHLEGHQCRVGCEHDPGDGHSPVTGIARND